MGISLMICGLFWIAFALIQNTGNFKSTLLYKIAPAVTGMIALYCGSQLLS